jgi:uncharacterized repeat protein (TIGR03803 family)
MFGNGTGILGGAVVLSVTLSAQTFTSLYNFGSRSYDGTSPGPGILLGPHGELYGTTVNGGPRNFGTVYELLPPASPGGAWTEVVLHSFNGNDGEGPSVGLLMGPGGAVYGVTPWSLGGYGTAFELDPPTGGSTHWREAVIYRFTSANVSSPSSALEFGSGGSLYGTAGTKSGFGGAIYSLTPPAEAGGAWTETTLYSFTSGSAGSVPLGPLAVGSNGTLFGVTTYGGKEESPCNYRGCGTVFSLTPPAVSGEPWTEQLLYGFNPQIGDGYSPYAGVVLAAGVLYGTTSSGGGRRRGAVFSLTPPTVPGAPMTETILHVFNGSDGITANSPLALGPNGVLYGTTIYGGANDRGTVFELAPPASPGGRWTETILHSFNGTDGYNPMGIALGPDGTLYGTTLSGGTSNQGTVFALKP